MKTLFTIVLIGATIALNAQTRRIAHRFHSGADTERMDGADGSYGGPYIPYRKVTRTDTLHEVHGKDSVVRLVDTTFYILDTADFHQSRIDNSINDVREYGKICSRYTEPK